MKVFGRKETIGNYALSKLEAYQQRLDGGDAPDALIEEAGRELGDSVEKVIFINRALDRERGP